MAVNKAQTFGDIPYTKLVQITDADGTTKKDLAVADANGAGLRLDFVRLATNLATATDVEFFLYEAGTGLANSLGVQSLPANSGKTNAIPIHEAMEAILPDSLLLKPGDKLQIAVTSAIVATKTIWATCFGMDLTGH